MENDWLAFENGKDSWSFVLQPSKETVTAGSSGLSFPAAEPETAANQNAASQGRQ
ncbi:MAG: hypothetical protein KHX31_01865 [Akkermansia sp.]|uniref:hypothetical protein n=1 Tax=Akkermansia sp. TaxID=1872421 RepID=UPI0025BA9D93|nr:hypothetical protein [Akkermansia sp.]MBS5507359.1 hypothetical protein [Akkermansia sp.]